MILVRVVLGHPFVAEGPLPPDAGPPEVPGCGVPHDSVIAPPGIPTGQGKGNGESGMEDRQQHWEFVLPAGDRAYPELIVRFEVPLGW